MDAKGKAKGFLLFFLHQEIFQSNQLETVARGTGAWALADLLLLAHGQQSSYKLPDLSPQDTPRASALNQINSGS